jgi:hypothetical protein
MKNKTPLVFGGVFLALVAIYFVTSFRPSEVTRGADPIFKDGLPDIDKVEVLNPRGENVTLERANESWNITSPITYKADPQIMTDVMNTLRESMVDEIISSNVGQQPNFGVSDSTAINLKVYSAGKIVLDVLIGKFTPDLYHTYVRPRNSNDIAIWRGALFRVFNRGIDQWRDRAIYSFNPQDITSVKAVEGRNTRQLTLSDTTWVYTENGRELPIDQNKAQRTAVMLATLSCNSFGADDDIPRAGSTPPDTKVIFTVRNGDTHSFDLWSPKTEADRGRYLIRTEKADVLFRLYESGGMRPSITYDQIKP